MIWVPPILGTSSGISGKGWELFFCHCSFAKPPPQLLIFYPQDVGLICQYFLKKHVTWYSCTFAPQCNAEVLDQQIWVSVPILAFEGRLANLSLLVRRTARFDFFLQWDGSGNVLFGAVISNFPSVLQSLHPQLYFVPIIRTMWQHVILYISSAPPQRWWKHISTEGLEDGLRAANRPHQSRRCVVSLPAVR